MSDWSMLHSRYPPSPRFEGPLTRLGQPLTSSSSPSASLYALCSFPLPFLHTKRLRAPAFLTLGNVTLDEAQALGKVGLPVSSTAPHTLPCAPQTAVSACIAITRRASSALESLDSCYISSCSLFSLHASNLHWSPPPIIVHSFVWSLLDSFLF